MTERGGEGFKPSDSFKKEAFKGERIVDKEWVKKLDEWTEKMDQVFHPTQNNADLDFETRGREFIQDFNEDKSFENIAEMINYVDNSFPEDKEGEEKLHKIEENLELFPTVVANYLLNTKDRRLSKLTSGSLDDLKKGIPVAWLGSEEAVRNNFIDDVGLVFHLNKLDKLKNMTDFGDFREAISFTNAVETIYEELNKKTPGNQKEAEQLLKVIPFLKYNLDYIKGKMSIMDREKAKIPKEKEQQRELARRQLRRIIATECKPGDLFVMNESKILADMLGDDRVDKDVKAEISMVEKTITLSVELTEAGGFMHFNKAARKTVPSVLDEAQGKRYMYAQDDIECYWGEANMCNLPFREIWDKLQLLNFGANYPKTLKNITEDSEFLKNEGIQFQSEAERRSFIVKGVGRLAPDSIFWKDTYTNYYCDSKKSRKDIVDKYIKYTVNKDRKLKGLDDYSNADLDYALVVSKLVQVATGEDTKGNIALIGHRDDIESIYIGLSARDRMEHFKSVDFEDIAFNLGCFGNTFLGYMCDFDAISPLLSKDIKAEFMDEAKKNQGYYANLLMKIGDVAQEFSNETITPKDYLDEGRYRGLYDRISKVAKTGGTIVRMRDGKFVDNFERDEKGNIKYENGKRVIDKKKVAEIEQRIKNLIGANIIKQLSNHESFGWTNDDFKALKTVLTATHPFEYYFIEGERGKDADNRLLNEKLATSDLESMGYTESQWQKKIYTKKKEGGNFEVFSKPVSFMDEATVEFYQKFYDVDDHLDKFESRALERKRGLGEAFKKLF